MRWFTSDQHFGHIRIAELACRPFSHGPAGTLGMDHNLIHRYNARVRPGDEAWFLGDFAMGQISFTLILARVLTGRKVLVPGNHDRCFPGYYHDSRAAERAESWRQKYLDAGFAEVLSAGAPGTVMTIGGEQVSLSHFPYRGGGDSGDEERFGAWRLEDDGRWLLCGHVHQKWRQRGKMINVGVDAWGGFPVSQEMIESLIASGPNDLEPLSWSSRRR